MTDVPDVSAVPAVDPGPPARPARPDRRRYVPVAAKFGLALAFAAVWVGLSVWISRPWVAELDAVVGAVRTTARGEFGLVTSRGRVIRMSALEVPTLPPLGGAPALSGGAPLAVFVDLPHGSPLTVVPARVGELEPYADEVRVTTTTPGGEVLSATVTAAAVGELDLYPGRYVFLAVKATAVTVYPV